MIQDSYLYSIGVKYNIWYTIQQYTYYNVACHKQRHLHFWKFSDLNKHYATEDRLLQVLIYGILYCFVICELLGMYKLLSFM